MIPEIDLKDSQGIFLQYQPSFVDFGESANN